MRSTKPKPSQCPPRSSKSQRPDKRRSKAGIQRGRASDHGTTDHRTKSPGRFGSQVLWSCGPLSRGLVIQNLIGSQQVSPFERAVAAVVRTEHEVSSGGSESSERSWRMGIPYHDRPILNKNRPLLPTLKKVRCRKMRNLRSDHGWIHRHSSKLRRAARLADCPNDPLQGHASRAILAHCRK
jgi:hypothetical protein